MWGATVLKALRETQCASLDAITVPNMQLLQLY
jgi:hypothetical protein